jgi:hypothetical protein
MCHGPQYISDVFKDELKHLGAESSPSFIAAPQGADDVVVFGRTKLHGIEAIAVTGDEHGIWQQHVQVNVEIQRAAKRWMNATAAVLASR